MRLNKQSKIRLALKHPIPWSAGRAVGRQSRRKTSERDAATPRRLFNQHGLLLIIRRFPTAAYKTRLPILRPLTRRICPNRTQARALSRKHRARAQVRDGPLIDGGLEITRQTIISNEIYWADSMFPCALCNGPAGRLGEETVVTNVDVTWISLSVVRPSCDRCRNKNTKMSKARINAYRARMKKAQRSLQDVLADRIQRSNASVCGISRKSVPQ